MSTVATHARSYPAPGAVLELLKPITWFPPMWAYACGVVSSGAPLSAEWLGIVIGAFIAGPLVCGTSQAVNDWYDRHVDAINEPNRPIPSGRIPGRWGLWVSLVWTGISIVAATALGLWGFVAALVGLALAWAYSAPPFRLKRNGWYGNAAVGMCYETLPWFTGAAVALAAFPDWRIVLLAFLYGVGAHGIMTLNDFKAIEGDKKMGVRSLPVQLGPERAIALACVVMAAVQVVVVACLFAWDRPVYALAVAALLVAQFFAMARLSKDPRGLAPWYNATGVTLYVLGMLVSAFAVRGFSGGIA